MSYSQSPIAKQYARAYMREFGDSLTQDDIEHMKTAISFFRRHHNFMSLVSAVTALDTKKHTLIDEIIHHFSLQQSMRKLVDVLINHNRLIYFAQVLQDICCLYGISRGILELTMYSATELSPDEIKKFETFFTKESGKQVVSRVQIQPELIAGVCLRSDLFFWEYSIAARLAKLKHRLLIEG